MCSSLDAKKEACKTYVEQTKQLITLASAFIIAPVGLVAVLKDRVATGLTPETLRLVLMAQSLLLSSVVFGYMVMACVTGSQDDGSFNVYRPTTRLFSLAQFGTYLCGIGMSIYIFYRLAS